MVNEVELSVEHVLLFVIIAFLLYHLLGNCGCTIGLDGFSVSTNDLLAKDIDVGDLYKPTYYDYDGIRTWFGCVGSFGSKDFNPCPFDAVGTKENPPDTGMNLWNCKKTYFWNDDECVLR